MQVGGFQKLTTAAAAAIVRVYQRIILQTTCFVSCFFLINGVVCIEWHTCVYDNHVVRRGYRVGGYTYGMSLHGFALAKLVYIHVYTDANCRRRLMMPRQSAHMFIYTSVLRRLISNFFKHLFCFLQIYRQ